MSRANVTGVSYRSDHRDDLQNEQKDEQKVHEAEKESPLPSQGEAEKNVEVIVKLQKEEAARRSFFEKLADKVTQIAGSGSFIVFHILWFTFWILINVKLIPQIKPFDPYPFNFLTMVVSLEAIFLSLLVLLVQNRMTKESDKRAHLDLQLNMLAEEESTMLLRMVSKISKKLGIEEDDEAVRQLKENTDVEKLEKYLEQNLPK